MTTATQGQWKKVDGGFDWTGGDAQIRENGERLVAILKGDTLKGESGGVRYFSTPQRAAAALREATGQAGLTVAEEKKSAPTVAPPAKKAEKAAKAAKKAVPAPVAETTAPTAAAAVKTARAAVAGQRIDVPGGFVEPRPAKKGEAFRAFRADGSPLTGPTGGMRLFREFDAAAAALAGK